MTENVEIIKEICDKSKYLFARGCERTDNEEVQRCLQLAIKTICRLESMLPDSGLYMIAFAGLTNVGKSTFLNALLGEIIAPAKNVPWSSTPIEYSHGEKIESILSYNGTFKKQRQEFDCAKDLLTFLESCATERSTSKTSAKLIVKFPSELLSAGVVIVDTPGFGATDGQKDTGLHDEILLKYIKETKNLQRIFWIVKGDNIDNSAVDFFHQHLSEKCTDLIVNMTSDMDEAFKKEYEERFRPQIGDFLNIHYVNAKKALKGMQSKDDSKLRESGILQIRKIINEISQPEGRAEIVKNDLLSLYRDLCEHLDVHSQFWMPTSLGMLKQMVEMTNDQNFIEKFNQYFK